MQRPRLIWLLYLIFCIMALSNAKNLLQLGTNPSYLVAAMHGWSWLLVLTTLAVTALAGYAAWQYYQMTSGAVRSGLIALTASVIHQGLSTTIALLDINLAQQAYTLSRIERGMSVDLYYINLVVSPGFLMIALGIGLLFVGIGMALVLISRKYFSSEALAQQTDESA
jgi:hypothetical protein